MQQVLKKPTNFRKKRELASLKDYFKDHELFKDIEKHNEEATVMSIFKSMKMEVKKAGIIVFRYGNLGDLFYLILTGSVGVKVPSKIVLNFKDFQFWQYLIKHQDDIVFEKTKIEDHIMRQIQMRNDNMHNRSTSLGLDSVVRERIVYQVNEVSTIEAGKSFGELVLMSSKPRAATILL